MKKSWSHFGSRSRLAGRAVWLLAALLGLGALGLLLAPTLLPPGGLQTAQAVAVIDTAALDLLDERTRVTLSGLRYNRATRLYLGSATVANTGAESLPAPCTSSSPP